MNGHHRTFVAIACVFIHSCYDDDEDDDDDDDDDSSRHSPPHGTRSFVRDLVRDLVRSFVISTRETRETSTLDARSHEWMGGWVDRGAADDDDDDA